MFNASIRIRKEYQKYSFENGDTTEVQGVRICIAPKVEKFIVMENLTTGKKSNLELVGYCNPNFAQWYHNSPVGTELVLKESEPKKISVSNEFSEIYTKSENDL